MEKVVFLCSFVCTARNDVDESKVKILPSRKTFDYVKAGSKLEKRKFCLR